LERFTLVIDSVDDPNMPGGAASEDHAAPATEVAASRLSQTSATLAVDPAGEGSADLGSEESARGWLAGCAVRSHVAPAARTARGYLVSRYATGQHPRAAATCTV